MSAVLLLFLGALCVLGCRPKSAPGPVVGAGPDASDGLDGDFFVEPEPPPPEEPEFVVDPATRPDWADLPTGIGSYRGTAALVGIGVARGQGEQSMIRLVARRKARAQAHRISDAIAHHLARKQRLGEDSVLLLETQLRGFVDVLLPDSRRFVPAWQDRAQGRTVAAVLIPLDRFLATIRDSWNVPESVRSYLKKHMKRVTRDVKRLKI